MVENDWLEGSIGVVEAPALQHSITPFWRQTNSLLIVGNGTETTRRRIA